MANNNYDIWAALYKLIYNHLISKLLPQKTFLLTIP